MTVAPIGAVGAEPAQALQQTAQTQFQNPTTGGADTVAAPQATVSLEMPSASAPTSQGPEFVNSVLDSVYSEIDKLSSQVPSKVGTESAVDSYKKGMASGTETTNPMTDAGIKDDKQEAVTALSKTFDHAIFMAMVNQVVSGVSDTSRTLIRHS